ncbi:hypothetical protein MMC27_000934 [Xylographa pallens]|nr:hypothetical protein [Xylographa pallens]
MSGIEVAGLVLGAYPVLILTAQALHAGFRELQNWREFRSRFEDFSYSLEVEESCYRNILRDLLCCGPDPYMQCQDTDILLNDPKHVRWYSEELVNKLEHRLGDDYKICVVTLGKMAKAIEELHKLLDIHHGQIQSEGLHPSMWQKKFEHVRFAFGTKRIKKLDELYTHNRTLERLLQHSDKFVTMRRASNRFVCAKFFAELRGNASNLHAILKASWTCECDSLHKIGLRLEDRSENRKSDFNIVFESPSKGGPSSGRQEVVIKLMEGPKDKQGLDLPPSHEESFSSNGTDASVPVLSFPKDTKRLPVQRQGGEVSTNTSLHALAVGKDMPVQDKDKVNGSDITRKLVKRRKIIPTASGQTTSLLPESERQRQTLADNKIHSQKRIKDLCSIMYSPVFGEPCTYYLLGDSKFQCRLYRQVSYGTLSCRDAINLEVLLAGLNGQILSRRQRVLIASTLASSLLQFQKTSWVPSGWLKKDIWLYDDGTKLLEQPYIAESFRSLRIEEEMAQEDHLVANQISKEQDRFDTPLIRFGILLLELCFGETIEARRARKLYASASGQSSSLADFATALEWEGEVIDDFPDFLGPIKCCLESSCSKKENWNSEKFLQEMYVNLVQPLRDAFEQNFLQKI